MKEIYILRHANWNFNTGHLKTEGKEKCLKLKSELPKFEKVISTPEIRGMETAELLTDTKPVADLRAGILKISKEENEMIGKKCESHPFGPAGVIFSIPELREKMKEAGKNLVELIKETLNKISKNEKILIISHDGTMVSAEKLLKKESFLKLDHSYKELEGFIVNENLKIKKLK